jgi:hypothetical protein
MMEPFAGNLLSAFLFGLPSRQPFHSAAHPSFCLRISKTGCCYICGWRTSFWWHSRDICCLWTGNFQLFADFVDLVLSLFVVISIALSFVPYVIGARDTRFHILTLKSRVLNFKRAHIVAIAVGIVWFAVIIALFIAALFSQAGVIGIAALGALTIAALFIAVPALAIVVLRRLSKASAAYGSNATRQRATKVRCLRVHVVVVCRNNPNTLTFVGSQMAKLSIATSVLLMVLFISYLWLVIRRYIQDVMTVGEYYPIEFLTRPAEWGTVFVLLRMLGQPTLSAELRSVFCSLEPSNTAANATPKNLHEESATGKAWSMEVGPRSANTTGHSLSDAL